jgi:MinD superfamily P-loop ATPase
MPLYKIDEMGCEGCSLCAIVCPAKAIFPHKNQTGERYLSQAEGRPMVHARLGIAEENSGKLVSEVRKIAAQMAAEQQLPLIISDGPPGTSCPVIASITNVDHVLIVTEPTVSGVHDLQRILTLCQHFGVSASILINKADLNPEQAQRIQEIAEKLNIVVMGKIPFDRHIHDALMRGKTIMDYAQGSTPEILREIWIKLQKEIALA